jgi:hypothetical protein
MWVIELSIVAKGFLSTFAVLYVVDMTIELFKTFAPSLQLISDNYFQLLGT